MGFNPVIVNFKEEKNIAWCGCKKTANAPFCDGAHSNF